MYFLRDLAKVWYLGMALLPLAFSFVIFALVYRFVPNDRISWRDVWPGALLAAFLFEVAKNAFAWYLANFANYSLVCGSLGAVIAFLFWSYLSALILLLGAELASEYSRLLGLHREPRRLTRVQADKQPLNRPSSAQS